ncbi:terminase large subunit [uncultured Mediterranean phage]|nr:terminase large subunit [uncultured Mediterranean phage]
MSKTEQYLGNPNLKKAHTPSRFTKKQIEEVMKCLENPKYFIEQYLKIVTIDKGLVPFEMYDFQRKMVDTFHDNRFTICKLPRQSGKSTIIVSYLLHYVLFNDNVNVAILANKSSTARDLLGRLQLAYEHLPKWMQQGVLNWNKGSLELENGSRIVAASTSSSAVRGSTFNIIFLDEFAYVPNNIAEEFFSSVYPTISSGKSSKVMIVSTPHGMNMFYKMWIDATNKNNNFVPVEVHWSEVPGRDEKWKEETIKNTSEAQFQTEFECEFLGSIDTLINASKIKALPVVEPKRSGGLDVYEMPKKGHIYTVTVDVSRGLTNDYSAFCVIDCTKAPYKLVAKYRDNEIKPLVFPSIIERVAKTYNKAYILVEINDLGQQVADNLQFELEYDNMMMVTQRGRSGQVLGGGFSGRGNQLGLRMTKGTKKIGTSNLKSLIEGDKLLISDFDIISELSTFISKGKSFEAESGATDDLVMCLVIFSWLANQRYFKELTNVDVRGQMFTEQQNAIEADMAPFGFIDDGLNDPEGNDGYFVDAGEVWRPVSYRKGE